MLFPLTNCPTTHPPNPKPNGPLHIMLKTIRDVLASAAKVKTGSIFLGAQEACPMVTALTKLGHLQPPHGTPIETDNSMAYDILKVQVQIKHLRSNLFEILKKVRKFRRNCAEILL